MYTHSIQSSKAKSKICTENTGKDKGTGKGQSAKKKLDKTVVVVSSDSEDSEVDFPHHPLKSACRHTSCATTRTQSTCKHSR